MVTIARIQTSFAEKAVDEQSARLIPNGEPYDGKLSRTVREGACGNTSLTAMVRCTPTSPAGQLTVDGSDFARVVRRGEEQVVAAFPQWLGLRQPGSE